MRSSLLFAIWVSALGFHAVLADDEPGPISPEEVVLERPVDFRQDVLPFLRTKCLACHSASVKEGSLILESVEGVLKGGDSGPGVVAGKPEESLVYQQAARLQESFMPPLPNDANAKPLTPRELGLLKLWIQEGAKESTSTGAAISWQSLPAGLQPIYSLALSPDETLVAAGQGNRIVVYDVVRQKLVAMPGDPALGQASHRDFVHSIDISSDGQWIASGGYRVVKLWKKAAPIESERSADGPIAGLAVSPDRAWAVIARPDGSLRLEPSRGGEARSIDSAGGAVTALTVSSDSAGLLAAVGETLRRWNIADAGHTGTIVTPSPIQAVVTSADGQQIITGHADGIIRVWAAEQLAPPAEGAAAPAVPKAELKGHEKPVTALQWADAEGPKLVSGSEDGTVRAWDVVAGAEARKIDNGAPVTGVACSPDGKQVATTAADGLVRIWDTAGTKVADLSGDPRQADLIARLKENLTVAQSRKTLADTAVGETEKDITGREESLKKANEQLAAAQKAVEEAKAKVPDAEQKQKAAADAAAAKPDDEALKKALTEAEATLKAAQEAVTKAEDGVVSAKRGIELSETSIATAKAELETRKQHRDAEVASEKQATEALSAAETQAKEASIVLKHAVFTTDGSSLATVDAQGLATLWHVPTKRALTTVPTELSSVGLVDAGDGQVLAAGSDGRLLLLGTEPKWELAGQLGPADDTGDVTSSVLLGRVLAVDFNLDGSLLAVGSGVPSRSGQLTIWNVAEKVLDKEIPEAHSDTVFSVAFSRDGTQLASGGADKFAKVFDVVTGELRNTFEGHTSHVLGVGWIADGSRVATGGADNAIKVWNTATSEQTRTITTHQKPVQGLSFIGISENIISAGGDNAVLLHTASNGKNYRRCDGSTDFVHAVVVSRDESLVVAGGEDGVLRLWNGTDGKLITSFDPPAVPASGEEQASR